MAIALGLAFVGGLVGCGKRSRSEGESAPRGGDPVPEPVSAPPRLPRALLERVGSSDGATVVLAKLGARTVAYVADEDDLAIRAVDVDSHEELGRTPLPGRPAQMIAGKDGRLYVAVRDAASVHVLSASADPMAPLDTDAMLDTAVEPIGLAFTPSDDALVVVSGWGHTLETFALDDLARKSAVDLAREPRAVTVSKDGKTAFVAHAAAGHVSAVALAVGGEGAPDRTGPSGVTTGVKTGVKTIDVGLNGWTERRGPGHRLMLDFAFDADPLDDHPMMRCGFSRMRTITFPARKARQSFALAKIEDRIFAPHVAVATGDALAISSGYGGGGVDEGVSVPTEMFDIDVIDAVKSIRATGNAAKVSAEHRVGPNACRLPRAATVDAERKALFVTCLGSDTVVEYDATSATPTAAPKRIFEVPSGPTGTAIDGSKARAVVWSAFDRTVSVLSLGDPEESTKPTKSAKKKPTGPTKVGLTERERIVLAPRAPLAADVALGRKIFHRSNNAKVASDGRVCASCHPDGRDDGLVWSTPEGPRQTIFLAGRVGREAPFGWLGKHPSLREHVKVTMKNLGGTGLSDAELDALSAYLRAMKPPPRAPDRSSNAEAEHGRELFHSSLLGCASCHAEQTDFSDREAHDVGSATVADANRAFLVPSLRFVGGSGPYFHDGRYATLGELLEKNEKMGSTKSLSPSDRSALEAYLRTL